MRVLVTCEFSGRVRDAFSALGHEAWSCDLLPSDTPGNHYQEDVRGVLWSQKWDLMVAHPPCTRLAVSGARWWATRREEQELAVQFVQELWTAPIPRICIENPIGILPRFIGKATQIIQPWQFGHGETKATCLWLKGLPKLTPTNVVEGREARIHRMSPSPNRARLRSITYEGIAAAMAQQWGSPATP
jgi:hypothetical protein